MIPSARTFTPAHVAGLLRRRISWVYNARYYFGMCARVVTAAELFQLWGYSYISRSAAFFPVRRVQAFRKLSVRTESLVALYKDAPLPALHECTVRLMLAGNSLGNAREYARRVVGYSTSMYAFRWYLLQETLKHCTKHSISADAASLGFYLSTQADCSLFKMFAHNVRRMPNFNFFIDNQK